MDRIIESYWQTNIAEQHIADLFESLWDIVSLRSPIDKESTPRQIEHFAAVDRQAVKLTQQYLIEGGSPDSTDDGNLSLLKFAAICGSVPLARLLLSKGADVNYNGWGALNDDFLPRDAPLARAVESLNPDVAMVSLLLQYGADLDATYYGMDLEKFITTGTMSWIGDQDIYDEFETIVAIVRAEPERRIKEKRLVLSMALHGRVGELSWVQDLDLGVVQMIMGNVQVN
jgi:hypothetical protein